MTRSLVFGLGFCAQALFSARLLVQWISSEKAGRSLSPLLFWQLSIVASVLLMLYGVFRRDIVIVIGQIFTFCVYFRNLHYHRSGFTLPPAFALLIVLSLCAAIPWLLAGQEYNPGRILHNEEIPLLLLLWGGAGQLIFNLRFLYQLVCAERAGESILPLGFWVISIIGSLMVISYAVFRRDPVLFVGQLFGFVVYARNIMLIGPRASAAPRLHQVVSRIENRHVQ